jgi:hypothetical protein
VATPFDVRGSSAPVDPQQAAALQIVREQAGAGPAPQAPVQAPVGPGGPAAGAAPTGENPVAALLVQAMDLFMQRGGLPEDIAAWKQAVDMLQQMLSQMVPTDQAAGAPVGAQPVGAPAPAPVGPPLPPV